MSEISSNTRYRFHTNMAGNGSSGHILYTNHSTGKSTTLYYKATYVPVSVNPQPPPNPGDSDSFLTFPPRGVMRMVFRPRVQGQF